MIDSRQPATFQTSLATLHQLLEDTFGAQTDAIHLAVRRGTLDLGTAAELLEHQVAARWELMLRIAPALRAAAA